MFKEVSHDFGNVAKNSKAEYRFEIENPFNEEITIAKAETSCHCTEVSLTKTTLKSREKGELIAKFNTAAFEGFRQATVTVRFAPPFVGEAQLQVKGNIRPDVVFQPGSIDFGEVNRSVAAGTAIAGFAPWQFELENRGRAQHLWSRWRFAFEASTRPNNSVNYTMTVRLTDSVPAGFQQGELIVVTEEFGRRSEIPVTFSGKVVSDLQVSPEVLTINAIKPGDQVTRKVVVTGTQPFRILDVTCTNTSFRWMPIRI